MINKKVTLSDYMLTWLKVQKFGELKRTSYDRLERTIEKEILPVLGDKFFTDITDTDIKVLINKMILNNYSYSMVKKVYDALNSCYKYAVIKGDIDKNPMRTIKTPSKHINPPKEIRILTEQEIKLIKEEINRTYANGADVWLYGQAYLLMLNIGVRPGELLGLKWSDVDFEKRIIKIQRNVAVVKCRGENFEKKNGYEVILQNTPKTLRSIRNIYLNNNAILALNKLKIRAKKTSDFIITNKKGEILDPQQLRRTFHRILNNVGIEKVGLHALRHTFASLLFQNGCDVKVVSKLLGHSNVKITYEIYIHLIEGQENKELLLLDQAI